MKVALVMEMKHGLADEMRHLVELVKGPAAAGFEEELRRSGLVKNTLWTGEVEGRKFFFLNLEGDDPFGAMMQLQTTTNPVGVWIRENILRGTKFDPSDMNPLELLIDWERDSAERAVKT